MPRAALDACVLYPAGLRDLFLRAAEAGYFQPVWSQQILDEMMRALQRNVEGMTVHKAQRLASLMNRAFPEATVEGFEHLIDAMPCDPSDRHVLAAAVGSGAGYLVTHNRRHFPSALCWPVGVKIIDPDMFLVGTLGLTGQKGWNLIEAMAFDTLNPP